MKARLADGEDKTWYKAVQAGIDDVVEFQIEYDNTSSNRQYGVAIKDVLPESLSYIDGSTSDVYDLDAIGEVL